MDIRIDNLSKSFGTNTVLKNINLNVEGTKTVGILGPSGGGKTTLLRLFAGLEKPSSGNIAVNGTRIPFVQGVPVDRSGELRNYRKQLGVVFQSYNLLSHLDALSNITLPLIKVHGYEKKAAEDRGMTLLTQFSLADHAQKHPYQLSGGQKQRIAICRAIAPSPEFLLFDEPTSALDPDFIMEVLETIKGLKDICDFMVVTHHIGFARSVADHILFLADGRIVEQGPPWEIFDKSDNPVVSQFFANALY